MTVVVVNWNTRDLLHECLASLEMGGGSSRRPMTVVDNASTDGSADMISEEFPDVGLVKLSENRGYATAANRGLRVSQDVYGADLALVLNSDTTVEPGVVDVLADFMRSTPDAGAVGPAILNADGSVYESGRRFLSFPRGVVHLALGYTGLWPDNPFTRQYKMTDWDRSDPRRVDWVSGAAVLLRMEAAGAIGFFDEGYHMYMEDVDLCFRLAQAGWGTYYMPGVGVVHVGGASTSSYPPLGKVARHITSAARYYRRAGWSGRPHV